MENAYRDVKEFMEAVGQEAPDELTQRGVPPDHEHYRLVNGSQELDSRARLLSLGTHLASLRARLVLEEASELLDALAADDLVQIADAVVDICYVAIGTAIAYGISLPEVWEAVQEANMAKLSLTPEGEFVALKDENGKIIKPEGWVPPDVAAVLDRQRRGER